MSLVPSKPAFQPNATQGTLQARADFYETIRQFFKKRGVLAVETPLLAQAPVTDPFIQAFSIKEAPYYLQTSPEYAMKRLLAAGCPSIYQLAKAFRVDEAGRYHNPEFSILEWYRLGFTLNDLMDEVDDLFYALLETKPAERLSYQAVFQSRLGIDPFTISVEALQALAKSKDVQVQSQTMLDKDDWLQILFSDKIEPELGQDRPVFIYDYPPSQAALAKLCQKGAIEVAERVEVYYKGIELGNGYHELQDPILQKQRFEADNRRRIQEGLPEVPVDWRLIEALKAGLPPCSGIAIGVDRLFMIKQGISQLADTLAFAWDRA